MTWNMIGTAFFGARDRCPMCRSVVRTEFLQILFPIVPLRKCRLKYSTPREYAGRRLR